MDQIFLGVFMSATAFSKLSGSARSGSALSCTLALALSLVLGSALAAPSQAVEIVNKGGKAADDKSEKSEKKTSKKSKEEKASKEENSTKDDKASADDKSDSKDAKIEARKLKVLKELCEVLAPGKAAQATMQASFAEQEKQLTELTGNLLASKAPKDISPEKLEAIKKQMIDRQLKVIRRTQQLFTEQIDMNKLCLDIYTEIYDKYFSEDELKKLLAFYKSPIGKRMVEMQPKIATEAIQLTHKEIDSKMLGITQQVVQEMLQQMKSEGTRLPGASKPAETPEIPAEILNTPIAPIMH